MFDDYAAALDELTGRTFGTIDTAVHAATDFADQFDVTVYVFRADDGEICADTHLAENDELLHTANPA